MDAGRVRVAVVQEPPVLLDREATLTAAVGHLRRAADGGARLVVFPEAYVPGYPVWIWRLRPEADYELTSAIHRELLANSIDLVADGLRPLRDAAAERGVVVVCGIHEREGEFSRATLYNTLVTIGADGAVLNRHRKLMPTNPERMVKATPAACGSRDRGRPGGVADLLGELHAASPVRAVRRRGRDLCGGHLGRRRHLDRDDAAHRGGGPLLGDRRGLLPWRRRCARRVPRPRAAVS